LADKVNSTALGLWLEVPEHLGLGTWDLLLGWTGCDPTRVEPRLALQLVHEAALCTTGIRAKRSLVQPGLAQTNGLPFLATDVAIHQLLGAHTVAQAQKRQRALGLLRRAGGDYAGKILVIDPQRVPSHSKRRMARRRKDARSPVTKMHQTFLVLDADTVQPVCFTTATASRTVTQATPELLALTASILGPQPTPALVRADAEHYSGALVDYVYQTPGFDLLVPVTMRRPLRRRLQALPEDLFRRHWPGYATAQISYQPSHSNVGPLPLFVQRSEEQPSQWRGNAYLCTSARDEVAALSQEYPKRWHIEEFFNHSQDLGWDRAGTQNLNIRYGHMTMALIAQAVRRRLRQRVKAVANWDAKHVATALLQGLEGDVRVSDKTIVVTYYNAPQAEQLREHYEGLPQKLRADNINPAIPWLFGYQQDFRFR
jgi:hypothetical protein